MKIQGLVGAILLFIVPQGNIYKNIEEIDKLIHSKSFIREVKNDQNLKFNLRKKLGPFTRYFNLNKLDLKSRTDNTIYNKILCETTKSIFYELHNNEKEYVKRLVGDKIRIPYRPNISCKNVSISEGGRILIRNGSELTIIFNNRSITISKNEFKVNRSKSNKNLTNLISYGYDLRDKKDLKVFLEDTGETINFVVLDFITMKTGESIAECSVISKLNIKDINKVELKVTSKKNGSHVGYSEIEIPLTRKELRPWDLTPSMFKLLNQMILEFDMDENFVNTELFKIMYTELIVELKDVERLYGVSL